MFDKGFWLWLCRYAYRRLPPPDSPGEPVGIPGRRDPDALCDTYTPKTRRYPLVGWAGCHGDGHYLCRQDCALYHDEVAEKVSANAVWHTVHADNYSGMHCSMCCAEWDDTTGDCPVCEAAAAAPLPIEEARASASVAQREF